MVTALKRPCSAPGGCSALVVRGRCAAHQRQAEQRRGSSSARGYDHRWRQYARAFRREFPLCGDRPEEAPATTDSVCRAAGRTVAAALVDHIVPVTGPDDPSFFDRAGHQSLCARCHDAKRQRESRS